MGNSTILQKFGYLFYIVSPNKTSFEKVEDVPDYTNEVGPLFTVFILVEMSILIYKRKWFVNDTIVSVSQGMLQQMMKIGFGWMTVGTYLWVYKNCRIVDMAWNSAWTWWICLMLVEFCYYWLHRASHEINVLWAAHQTHHSSEFYNYSVALRQPVLENHATLIFYLPIALFVPPPIFMVHWDLNTLYQFWIHTEYIKNLGPLEYILNTPSHHRVHHGRNRRCVDKNYGGFLIIWDRLFGTFEAEGENIVYGLTHPINTFDPIKIQLQHYLHIWNTFWNAESIGNKLSVLFKGPGWEPGKPWHGNIEDIPDVTHPVEPYNPTLPKWCNIYVFTHFILIVFGYMILSENYRSYDWSLVAVSCIYITFALIVIGYILDNSPSAALLEFFRCIAYLFLDYHFLPSDYLFTHVLRTCFILSALLWGISSFKTTLLKVRIKIE